MVANYPFVEKSRSIETPALLIDRSIIRRSYDRICAALPGAGCYYAVKANPCIEVLGTLAELGSGFEVSSSNELKAVLGLGVAGSRVISSNPMKTVSFVREAYRLGVDRFVVDSPGELSKLAEHAPGSRVYARVIVDNSGSEWPLTKKYGVSPSEAMDLLREARHLDLQPYGLTFHVGSQCRDVHSWGAAIRRCQEVWAKLAGDGINLEMLSLGGGFPVHHTRLVPLVEAIGQETYQLLAELFPLDQLEVTFEPGRALVGAAGTLVTTVIGLADRAGDRWLYLDAGVFNGLFEATEGFRYELLTERPGKRRFCVLAGPSCDSVDIIAQDVLLPDLRVGDRLYFLSAGAYTLSYASGFNGFRPPCVYAYDSAGQGNHPRELVSAALS